MSRHHIMPASPSGSLPLRLPARVLALRAAGPISLALRRDASRTAPTTPAVIQSP
jgi:hypothetical protein